jgi:hypothetical protein
VLALAQWGLSRKGGVPLPTELPVRTRSPLASEFELIALASLLPWCLSLLLACHDPAVAQAFLLMGQLG